MFDANLRVWINDSRFVIHKPNLKLHEQIFFKKLKITNRNCFMSSNLCKNSLDSTNFYIKIDGISHSMAFLAIQMGFSWLPSMDLLWNHCGEGDYSSNRPKLHLTLHFFTNHYSKPNSNPESLCYKSKKQQFKAYTTVTSFNKYVP